MAERFDRVPPPRSGEGGRSRSPRGILDELIIAPVAFALILLIHDHIFGVGGTRPRQPGGHLERLASPGVCSTRCPGAPQALEH
jgi:hypothetical protein